MKYPFSAPGIWLLIAIGLFWAYSTGKKAVLGDNTAYAQLIGGTTGIIFGIIVFYLIQKLLKKTTLFKGWKKDGKTGEAIIKNQ